jgi:hypothetical protein
MKYYYARQDLFGSTWVECSFSKYHNLQRKGVVPVRTVSDDLDVTSIPETEDEIHTPMKDAILDELRDTAPAIISLLFDEIVEEEDLQVDPQQVEYFIDEELINPDYDELEFGDAEEEVSDSVTPSTPFADSSTNINRWFPRAAITLPKGDTSINDIKRIQRAIYTLMEGGMVHDNDQLDGDKFVARLETHRDVTINTSQKDRANPSILFLPDFSPSCSSYASLYNTLLSGVSTIRDDFNVVSAPHFNGLPKWFVVNGVRDKKEMEYFDTDYCREDSDGDMWGRATEREDAQKFYAAVLGKRCSLYDISTVIIAGDMDGTWCYKLLLDNPQVERMIWVDGSYWSDEKCMTNRTSELLYKLDITGAKRTLAKSKLVYWSGVKKVEDFVRAIERSNSW